MSDELLDLVLGPTPYPDYWLWLCTALLSLLICWYAALFIVTSRRRTLAKARFIATVRAAAEGRQAGDLELAPAAATISRALRAFLHRATGLPIEYMQLHTIATGELSIAATILTELADAQFNPASTVDVVAASATVEELIRAWD